MMQLRTEGPAIRPPAVAGLFYPAEPARLRAEVLQLLAQAALAPAGLRAKALIAPHAGYAYSGAAAAAAFAALGAEVAEAVRRVVLIGPSHHVAFRGIAAPRAEAFTTPLGRVPVDREALSGLADLPFVGLADGPHAPDHALEVELPFLQLRLGAFAAVPLLVGEASPQEVAELLGCLWGGPETLIVVSSDLSHFHAYETAQRLDAGTAAAIERGDWSGLGPGHACGFLAVAGLLIEARRHGLRARRLALCNSGDTAGPRERVVGYGAWAFEEHADHRWPAAMQDDPARG
jgi:MEMO1 family protein